VSGEIKVLVLTGKGEVIEVRTLEDLVKVLQNLSEARVLIIRGELLGTLSYLRAGGMLRASETKGVEVEDAGEERVAAVLDQMFRGFADILLREVAEVEIHEVIGRGLEAPVKVGERLYRHPAKDDFDVLKIVENLAKNKKVVAFFTGDKKLAGQAAALGYSNVRVFYMPPNEYPGKESLAKAMISELTNLIGK